MILQLGSLLLNKMFVTLKQLFIDVQSQDNTAFRKYAQEYSGETGLDETFSNQYAKMKRFSSAFNSFFDHLKYKGISQTGGAYEILFEKHPKRISKIILVRILSIHPYAVLVESN